jgi:hypothetical protein
MLLKQLAQRYALLAVGAKGAEIVAVPLPRPGCAEESSLTNQVGHVAALPENRGRNRDCDAQANQPCQHHIERNLDS